MHECRGLCLPSTSVRSCLRFSFTERHIKENIVSTGRTDKTPVHTQNLPDEQRFPTCVVLPGPTSPEPVLALEGMEEAVSLWKRLFYALKRVLKRKTITLAPIGLSGCTSWAKMCAKLHHGQHQGVSSPRIWYHIGTTLVKV